MKAILLERHGDPSVLRWGEIATPECGPGQVRVRVETCALNHLDIWTRRGLPRRPLEFPHILGADVAGHVDAVGGGVVGIVEGDAVGCGPPVGQGVAVGVRAGRCVEGGRFAHAEELVGAGIGNGSVGDVNLDRIGSSKRAVADL